MVEGDHVPVIPLVEVVGKAGTVSFKHSVAIGSNVGRVPLVVTVTVTSSVALQPKAGIDTVTVYVVVVLGVAIGFGMLVLESPAPGDHEYVYVGLLQFTVIPPPSEPVLGLFWLTN